MRRARVAAVAIVLIGAAAPTLAHRSARHGVRVVAVYPSAPLVPSNLLRVYVEFTSPMQSDWARSHVRLLDDSGRVVERALLEMDEELWDPSQRRLTILFDPGRVKRGIRSNLEMGAPLIAGRRYRLVVDSGWPDGRGLPLVRSFTREFTVGDFDGTSPDPRRWTLSSPRRGTRDPLVVRFGEPLDHALAARLITVVDSAGTPIDGRGELFAGDTGWRFAPASTWASGVSTLRVSAALEDVAGNSIAHAFDSHLKHGAPSAADAVPADVAVQIPIR